ncbi:hypothetical protein [Paraburkholderia oxyphila]|uniref:hypothetical protein n=1 Tax=Paraburkholderia oxyphila TaxID=614212 RepID=UPI0005B956EE|nr:hypothetical protein [Paraburkholderia oxyphila]
MKDAFERRALLLHLGRALQLVARILETRPTAQTVGQLVALHPILEGEPLLAHVRPSLRVEDFVAQALQAFCAWPRWLLDDELDRAGFAASVRERLFEQNASGWRAYAASLRAEVAWFGLEQPGKQRARPRKHSRATGPAQGDADAPRAALAAVPARDIERDEDATERISESVEGFAPANGARRANEQYLPEFE